MYNDDDATHASKYVTIPEKHCDQCHSYKIRQPYGTRITVMFQFGNINNASELHTEFFINFSNFNLCKSYAVLAMTGFSTSVFSLLDLCTFPVNAILLHSLCTSRITDRQSMNRTDNFQFISHDRLQLAGCLVLFFISFLL